MKDDNNPFAAYAATSSTTIASSSYTVPKVKSNAASAAAQRKVVNNNDSNNGGGGWMTAKKSNADVQKSKAMAEEARRVIRNKNRKIPLKSAAKKKGGGRQKFKDVIDSEEGSFNNDEDDDDSFVVKSDEDEEMILEDDDEDEEEEDVWDSQNEDEDSDFGGKKKKKKTATAMTKAVGKKKMGKKTKATTVKRRGNDDEDDDDEDDVISWDSDDDDDSDFGGKKTKDKSHNKKTTTNAKKKKKKKSGMEDDSTDDDDDEIQIIRGPNERRRGKVENKTYAESPISLVGSTDDDGNTTMNDESLDDIYANRSSLENNDNTSKKRRSKYFATKEGDDEDGEEKKVDDNDDDDIFVLNRGSGGVNRSSKTSKKRMIMGDDDDDSSVDDFAPQKEKSPTLPFGEIGSDDDDLLSDTPRKEERIGFGASSFNIDDFADDDEAVAIQAALKASVEGVDKNRRRKRLKKKSSSMLEQIKLASPAKNTTGTNKLKKQQTIYRDDIEPMKDSDDDEGGNGGEDDEVEIWEANNDEEQTAAQVLAEANALSARIIKIVNGWFGANGSATTDDGKQNASSNNGIGAKVKGLILGEDEGALSLGGGVVDTSTNEWISEDTMKNILPSVKLAEYQLLGVNWMALLSRTMFGKGKLAKTVSGILADEMGLGKTVQTIAFLAWLNHQNKSNPDIKQRPHLIVVPASVLNNWMNEFEKFAPNMIVIKYHGNQFEREGIRNEMDRNFQASEPLDAVITTFSYFSSDSNKGDRSFLRKFNFDYLVVDEGHTLKNPKGLRYQNLNKFQTKSRLLLTGTPVQNSPKELMSLLCFLMPLFDRKTKSSKRKRGYADDSDDENDGGERMLEYFVQLEGGSDDARAYRKLKQLFAPFVLRRKKEDVLGQILPPKTKQIDIVPMDDDTKSAYNAIISDHVQARAAKVSGVAATQDAAAQKHLFTSLRKAANHPLLLRNRFKDEEDKANLAHLALNYRHFGNDASCTLQLVRDELDKFSDYEIHCAAIHMIEESPMRRQHLEKYTLMEEDLFCSPKFVRLRTLLPELINKGHRILIFSQWTKILDLMGHLLHSLQIDNHLRLDGSTAVSERQDMLDKFNNDPTIPVFLLSTRAGGMGLNLTAADVCILHDLDFNPFNDLQAEDRCHRIGQTKPVSIIKMVTKDTVDEDIYKIQERKSKMNDAIMEKQNSKNESAEMCSLANAAIERFLEKSAGST